MKKIKIERSLKLRQEDLRSRHFNVITNNQEPEKNWIDSFGGQKEQLYDKVAPKVSTIHAEQKIIAKSITEDDIMNNTKRVNMDYKSKMNITHSSSIRYSHIPKDQGVF